MKKRTLALTQVIVALLVAGPYMQLSGWVILPLAAVAVLLLQYAKEEEPATNGPTRLEFSEKVQRKLPWTER